ncbi:kirola-like [Cucumis melo var. makuwa]|uniref:Kirola-like n=1 Tax=Cucumis melo var. makuwa TaxID=1194695 RepID=A0A5D3DIJ7_CUCMM|nr:kirola-like [Cucumis melo var. makuwa]
MLDLDDIPKTTFAAYNVPHVSLHVPPPNSIQPTPLLQSNLYPLPPADSTANPSYHPEVRNPQIHLTFEVGGSSANSNLNVQVSSSSLGVAHQQLEVLQQQIAAIEATLEATFTLLVMAFGTVYMIFFKGKIEQQ